MKILRTKSGHRYGASHHRSIANRTVVNSARKRFKKGERVCDIAARLGHPYMTVYKWCHGLSRIHE